MSWINRLETRFGRFAVPNLVQTLAFFQLLVFGILGLFLLGIVFGPLAISQAAKAERLNKPAVAGKVLGWISLIFGILQLLGFILWFFAAAAVLTTM